MELVFHVFILKMIFKKWCEENLIEENKIVLTNISLCIIILNVIKKYGECTLGNLTVK